MIVLEYMAKYGNLENYKNYKINTLYQPVENFIHKNNDADNTWIDKRADLNIAIVLQGRAI